MKKLTVRFAAAALTVFLLTDSYGEIRFMTGNIMKKQDSSGGYHVWSIVSGCMTLLE